jgi:hypothetical protein
MMLVLDRRIWGWAEGTEAMDHVRRAWRWPASRMWADANLLRRWPQVLCESRVLLWLMLRERGTYVSAMALSMPRRGL